MKERETMLSEACATSEEEFFVMENMKTGKERNVRELIARRDSANLSSRGRVRRASVWVAESSVNEEDIINGEITAINADIESMLPLIEKAKNGYDSHKNALDEFKNEFKHRTEQELLNYAKTLIEPSAKYYSDKFNNENGDLYKIKQAARVAQLFDPLFIKDKTLQALELLADDMTYFGYDSICTPAFITNIKKEIPTLLYESKKDFNWDEVGN